MSKKRYREFYIYTKEGFDTWHWDLDQTDGVVADFFRYKDDPTFCIEIQDWYDGEYDYVEIYPTDGGIKHFPKYVQKQIYKVLDQIN